MDQSLGSIVPSRRPLFDQEYSACVCGGLLAAGQSTSCTLEAQVVPLMNACLALTLIQSPGRALHVTLP